MPAAFQYLTRPAGALRPWVKRLFFARGQPGYAREMVAPMGHPTLLVNLGRPFTRQVGKGPVEPVTSGVLLFQQTQAAEHVFESETHVVGAALTPDGGWALPVADASHYTDRFMPLAALWPDWSATEPRLRVQAGQGEACMDTLEAFLVARVLRAPDGPVRAAVAALEADPGLSIAALVASAGLSHRQFIQRFRATVGVAPKTLASLLRMVATMATIAQGPRPDWASVAIQAGYADQAHFARAFRRFNGLTPTEYGRRRRWAEGAVGLVDESGFFVPTPQDDSR